MIYFVSLFGLLLFVSSIVVLFFPEKIKLTVNKIFEIIPFWVWGSFWLIFAIIFWEFSKNSCFYFIGYFVSFVSLIEGLFFILTPKRKIKKIIESIFDSSEETFLVWGSVTMFLSFLVFILISC